MSDAVGVMSSIVAWGKNFQIYLNEPMDDKSYDVPDQLEVEAPPRTESETEVPPSDESEERDPDVDLTVSSYCKSEIVSKSCSNRKGCPYAPNRCNAGKCEYVKALFGDNLRKCLRLFMVLYV